VLSLGFGCGFAVDQPIAEARRSSMNRCIEPDRPAQVAMMAAAAASF